MQQTRRAVRTARPRCQKATEEISAQIAAMQAETPQAVEAIRSIARTIDSMDQVTGTVAAAAEEQSAATREIGRAVTEAASGTREVDRQVAGVTEGAQQAGSASAQIRGASGKLARQAEGLRTKMGGFLGAIRAA